MYKTSVHFLFGLLTTLRYTTTTGTNELLSHVQNPVQLSVGECISFVAYPVYRAWGNWTWRKDTITLSTTDRIVIGGNVLRISDATSHDSAYYSADVETSERRELFKFWLIVKDCDDNEKKNPLFQGRCKSWCEQKCEKGWKHVEGKCFKYFGKIKSWLEALDSCRSLRAKLAVIDNERKNKFIGSLLESGEGAWIGLQDRFTESVYVWNIDKTNKAAGYFPWAKNEPSNTNRKCNIENCVEMKYPGLMWNDMICNGHNSYVCQLNKDNDNVSSSWSCNGNNCYKYFREQLIWKDSKLKCEELGGELARITSSSVNHFVGGIIVTNVWIGLNDIAEPGTYVWNNFAVGELHDKASYFNWDNAEPNDKLYRRSRDEDERCSGEDCVQIMRWDNMARWNDLECSKKLPYVCEKSCESLLTVAAIIGISVGCTVMFILVSAVIHFQLKNRKHKVETKKLVFETLG